MHSSSSTALLLLLLLSAALLLLASPTSAASKKHEKVVVVTNNHTNYLSLRCFSFDDDFSVIHLKPWAQYQFKVRVRVFYPSATMFNCSTNMGNFVAFRYDYECSKEKYSTCDWRFDEENAYRWEPKRNSWHTYDYDPNYESLTRGGVIKGYYAN